MNGFNSRGRIALPAGRINDAANPLMEAFVVLLGDDYVLVHQADLEALRRLAVRDDLNGGVEPGIAVTDDAV